MSERGKRQRLPLSERFWFSVLKSEGCWEWQGCRNVEGGYGVIRFGKHLLTHRVSWELHNGQIPDGLCVLHHCDNPACVRPDHLFLGTHQENMDDKSRKGRNSPPAAMKGEEHENAKLRDGDIPLIRRAVAIGFRQKDVAAAYGVAQSLVSRIATGGSWGHIA
jgi:hypothetical protein